MDRKLAYLQMIQSVIVRMANNSFLIKGWSVTLIVALFALAAADDINEVFVYLAYVPAIMFWALDTYFLRQERLFRKLYDHVRVLDEGEVGQVNYSMDTSPFKAEVACVWSIAFSQTLALFHCTLTASIVVVTLLMIQF